MNTISERTFILDARFSQAGAWAGVEDLLDAAYAEMLSSGGRSTIDQHSYELHMVLQSRRAEIPLVRASLTELAEGSERTRNFPLDRAYRIVHGLVDFVLAWKEACGSAESWLLIIRRHDEAQHLARRFFSELTRRGRTRLIRTVVEAAGSSCWLDKETPTDERGVAAAFARPLPERDAEDVIGLLKTHADPFHDMQVMERHHPVLLDYFEKTNDPINGARTALRALCLYNHFGYYHESASFVDAVLPYFEELVGGDEDARWNYVGNIFQAMVMVGKVDDVRRLIEGSAGDVLLRPDLRARMHYLLAIVHLRYADVTDLEAAEAHIIKALACMEAVPADMPQHERAFLTVFIENGLAFLRVRQRRPQDAITLCQHGYATLLRDLGDEAHRLHRSVLQYNTAQVYAALGDTRTAIEHYDRAIVMDPNYSEYHNESGNLLLRRPKP